MENWESACDLVYALPAAFDVLIVEGTLPAFRSAQARTYYLRSFVAMARRGLFSHDARDGGYVLVARPRQSQPSLPLDEIELFVPEIDATHGIDGYDVTL